MTTVKVGDGASLKYWSDSVACTVIAVSNNGRKVTVQEDTATLINGFKSGEKDALQFSPGGFVGHTSGSQRYKFESNPQGAVHKFSLRKDDSWYAVGTAMGRGTRLSLKGRHHHYDYNF